ncbi:MAG: subtilisin-like serine protease [Alyxoria varia]|nr:MAG: subtilisin-like serine protease [Alyxoria varia]
MKFLTPLAFVSSVLTGVLVQPPKGAQVIPNKYIAVMEDSTHGRHFDFVKGTAQTILGFALDATFELESFKAFAFRAPNHLVGAVNDIEKVEYIEPDTRVNTTYLEAQSQPPWGLRRISQRHVNYNDYIYDSTAGSGTYSYIIDTGIDVTHPAFQGRAVFGANFSPDKSNADGNGHGTHVAGTVGSDSFGVAKLTNLVAVKVMGADGGGSVSGVLNGIDWAVGDMTSKRRVGKAVANLSLGGGYSRASNDAVAAAVRAGLFMAVAAGNENVDAAGTSPASEPSACTVGATDIYDRVAGFSNYGGVLDVFAPGVGILSTWIGGNGATNTISGTSMATPHIAGLAAYLLAFEGPRSPLELCKRIASDLATKGVITGLQNKGGSPNALASLLVRAWMEPLASRIYTDRENWKLTNSDV